MKKTSKGFTLIELLVVIAIIGVLSSVVLSSMNGARAKGRDAKRKAEMTSIQTALEMYYYDYGRYPIQYGWAGYGSAGCEVSKTLSGASGYIPDLAPTYMLILPTDPSGSTAGCTGYQYRTDTNGVNYVLLNHVTPESYPAAGTKFYDPGRPTWAWKVCNIWDKSLAPCSW